MTEVAIAGRVRVGFASGRGGRFMLTVSRDKLSLWCFGTHEFAPAQIVAIEPNGPKLLANGVRIRHNRSDCPDSVHFSCRGGPDRILAALDEVGFIPLAPASTVRPRLFTLRRVVLAVLVVYSIVVLTQIAARTP